MNLLRIDSVDKTFIPDDFLSLFQVEHFEYRMNLLHIDSVDKTKPSFRMTFSLSFK